MWPRPATRHRISGPPPKVGIHRTQRRPHARHQGLPVGVAPDQDAAEECRRLLTEGIIDSGRHARIRLAGPDAVANGLRHADHRQRFHFLPGPQLEIPADRVTLRASRFRRRRDSRWRPGPRLFHRSRRTADRAPGWRTFRRTRAKRPQCRPEAAHPGRR